MHCMDWIADHQHTLQRCKWCEKRKNVWKSERRTFKLQLATQGTDMRQKSRGKCRQMQTQKKCEYVLGELQWHNHRNCVILPYENRCTITKDFFFRLHQSRIRYFIKKWEENWIFPVKPRFHIQAREWSKKKSEQYQNLIEVIIHSWDNFTKTRYCTVGRYVIGRKHIHQHNR